MYSFGLFTIVWGVVVSIVALVALKNTQRLKRDVAELKRLAARNARWSPQADPARAAEDDAAPRSDGPAPRPAQAEPRAEAAAIRPTMQAQTPPPPPLPPRPASPRRDPVAPLIAWLATNWIAVAASLSLALAGIYLVIYGIEKGYITPAVRVWMATALGSVLIAAGEYLRRRTTRFPDEIVPAILAGAGLVTLYGTVVAADMLYGFLSQTWALVLLVAVTLASLALGGRHAVFLSAFGLIGAAAAPWIVGGAPGSDLILPGYYGLLALTGVALAWFRGWHVMTPLGGALALGLGLFPTLGAAATIWPPVTLLTVLGALMWLGAALHPKAPDAMTTAPGALRHPALAAALAVLALAHAAYVLVSLDTPDLRWTGAILLAGAVIAMALRAGIATLRDLPALPLLAAFLLALLHAVSHGPGWTNVAGLMVASALAIVFALRAAPRMPPHLWVFWAALMIGGSFGALEFLAAPARVLGTYEWALALLAAAGLATFAASRARRETEGLEASGLFAIAAFGLIALALTVTLDEAALTVALSITLVIAASLNLRLRLPFVATASALAIGGLVVRLVIYPGLGWGWSAPWLQLALAYGGTIAALAALAILSRSTWPFLKETSLVGIGILAPAAFCLVLFRIEAGPLAAFPDPSHWSLALAGMAIFASGFNLRPREGASRATQGLRMGAAVILSGVGLLTILAAAVMFSPLFNAAELVRGPVLLNSLAVTYLAPAALLVLALWQLPPGGGKDLATIRAIFGALCVLLALAWIFLVARHVWQGPQMATGAILPGEQTTYTVLMVILGTAAIWISTLVRPSWRDAVRRAGLVIIGATMAKALLIDASGLQGLARVLSFLILGLVLTGLAWADRRLGGKPVRPEDTGG